MGAMMICIGMTGKVTRFPLLLQARQPAPVEEGLVKEVMLMRV